MNELPNVAILVGSRGRGSNMQAIARACLNGEVPATAALVISPKSETEACAAAKAVGLPVLILSPKQEGYATQLIEALLQHRIDWICLAGYPTLLPAEVLDAFPNRVLNVHPALLPRHGGKGMYGRHVHEAVIASGDTESGVTVHLVDEQYDHGQPILQIRCHVSPEDTPETLAARVLALEHQAFPLALKQVIERS